MVTSALSLERLTIRPAWPNNNAPLPPQPITHHQSHHHASSTSAASSSASAAAAAFTADDQRRAADCYDSPRSTNSSADFPVASSSTCASSDGSAERSDVAASCACESAGGWEYPPACDSCKERPGPPPRLAGEDITMQDLQRWLTTRNIHQVRCRLFQSAYDDWVATCEFRDALDRAQQRTASRWYLQLPGRKLGRSNAAPRPSSSSSSARSSSSSSASRTQTFPRPTHSHPASGLRV